MINIRQIERMKYIHCLIKNECTGNPKEFASKLNISRRQLYNELELLKIQGAPLRYSRKNESFYYENYFELEINLSIKILNQKEIREIYAGNSKKLLPCKVLAPGNIKFIKQL